jgi:hypothetical protein
MRLILGLLIIAIFGLVVLGGTQAALTSAAESFTNTNETWTPNAGSVTALDDSKLDGADYEETVTVYNSSDVLMSNQTDYTWFAGNGTIKALSGGDLDGEASATVSYNYTRPPADARRAGTIAAQLPRLMGALALLIPVVLFFALIRGL